ncbi:MAG TPA: DUF6206 family protein [Nocardioides sp.]|uniref:DUF6206 family protein n=1 Tax=Nocardioides sp. TaxID=35761 RepID=UPI002C5B0083|nr:DUF6206 family protein [Nocardioides sp.]HQR28321.1 DUF6206 family protein [Nocardioides sp.]
MSDGPVSEHELAALEARVHEALVQGEAGTLPVLGYGEITLVLGWPPEAPTAACKRLPVFADATRAEAYGTLVTEYVEHLRAGGLDVLPTSWHTVPAAHGTVAGYVVQPVLPEATLVPRVLADTPEQARAVLDAVLDAVDAVVDPSCGLDAQLSNWAWRDSRLTYFDVTTPMLSDAAGRTRLDLAHMGTPLPAPLRPVLARFAFPGIVAAYHDRRTVVVDLVGNLLKERLDHVVDEAIAAANRRVTPSLTRGEIDRWYAGNARMWEALLRLRRADRWWQRRVRRRTYPFLLPGAIDR